MSSHNFSNIPSLPEFDKELKALDVWIDSHPYSEIISNEVAQEKGLNARRLSILLMVLSRSGLLDRTIWIKDPTTHQKFGPFTSPETLPRTLRLEQDCRLAKLEDLVVEAHYSLSGQGDTT